MSGAWQMWPTTPLSTLLLLKLPWPQSCPTTKTLHIARPVTAAYGSVRIGCSATKGDAAKQPNIQARSTAAYFRLSRVSGSKQSFGIACLSSLRDGTSATCGSVNVSAAPTLPPLAVRFDDATRAIADEGVVARVLTNPFEPRGRRGRRGALTHLKRQPWLGGRRSLLTPESLAAWRGAIKRPGAFDGTDGSIIRLGNQLN